MKKLISGIIVLCFMCLLHAEPPYLIYLSATYSEMMTSNILKQVDYIDTLPFDGVVLNGGDMWTTTFGYGFSEAAFKNTPVPYTEIYNQLQPLAGKFKNKKHFFIGINVVKTADFFDDWSVIINNWRMTARALKAAGPEFVGIFFDNEEYTSSKLWNYPDDVNYKTKTLAEYIAQTQLRGKQIIEACLAEFPEIKIIHAHGPYWSESKAPSTVVTQSGYIELAGPFFAGMVEAQTGQSLVIDGGENYKFRTVQDFETSYQWRKNTIASAANNSPNISASLRPLWPAKVSISFGVSDVGNNPSYGAMTPAIMRTTLENALNRCDDYVWYYPEAQGTYLTPGAVSTDWLNAIKGAYNAAKAPTNAPDIIVTSISLNPASPVAGQAVTFSATIKNQGTAATPAGVINGVLFTIDGAAQTWSDNNAASIAAGASVTVTANGSSAGAGTWLATAGSHTVDAWVNDMARYAESSTSNNHFQKTFAIATTGIEVMTDSVFSPTSFWYTVIPADVTLHANSANFVTEVLRQKSAFYGTVNVNTYNYCSPVFYATASTPRVRVNWLDCQGKGGSGDPGLLQQWASVPIPSWAAPSDGTDQEMTIYDPTTHTLWEFWVCQKDGTQWEGCWGGGMQNTSINQGIWPNPYGTTATGLPFLGGQVTAEELQRGEIRHAIGIALVELANWDIVSWPATRSDGSNPGNAANRIAEGQRFRLDPTINVDLLNMHPVGKTIAKAAQKYGFVVWDKAGSISIRAQNASSYTALGQTDPYIALYNGTAEYALLNNFPWDKLQFLPMNYGKPSSAVQTSSTVTGVKLSVHPNPVHSVARFMISGALGAVTGKSGIRAAVYDINGRMVADLSSKSRNSEIIWNAKEVVSGVYLVKMMTGNQTWAKKFTLAK